MPASTTTPTSRSSSPPSSRARSPPGSPTRSRRRSRWCSQARWCAAASTPSTPRRPPTAMTATCSWTGRPTGRPPPTPSSWRSTGWPGPSSAACPSSGCARRSTTCAPVSSWRRTTCPNARRWSGSSACAAERPAVQPLRDPAGGDPPGAVGPDGARRGPVADELHPRVDDRGGAVQPDAAVLGAQVQRRQVRDGRAEAGGPQDDVGGLEGAVGEADALGLHGDEHRSAAVGPEPLGGALLLAQRQAGDADHARRRKPAAYPLLDQRDRLAALVGGEVVGAPHRLAPGDPERLGDRSELADQLHGRGATADDHDAPAAEVL